MKSVQAETSEKKRGIRAEKGAQVHCWQVHNTVAEPVCRAGSSVLKFLPS